MAMSRFVDSVAGDEEVHTAASTSIKRDTLIQLTGRVMMDQLASVDDYCWGVGCVADHAGSAGCDVILEAGCIPVIIECLRRWPTHGPWGVVYSACWALRWLVTNGSASVVAAVEGVPDIVALVEAAKELGLDCGHAAPILEKLQAGRLRAA